jgi:hypothetical protein
VPLLALIAAANYLRRGGALPWPVRDLHVSRSQRPPG